MKLSGCASIEQFKDDSGKLLGLPNRKKTRQDLIFDRMQAIRKAGQAARPDKGRNVHLVSAYSRRGRLGGGRGGKGKGRSLKDEGWPNTGQGWLQQWWASPK